MGYKLSLPQDVFSDEIWEAEPFTYAQAYIDLVNLSKNGSFTATREMLTNRWQWEQSRFVNFINFDICEKTFNIVDFYGGIKVTLTRPRSEDSGIDEDDAYEILDHFNKVYDKNWRSINGFKKNLQHWLEEYTISQIKEAIEKSKNHHFWKDKMTPVILFRKKNTNQEPVDYIGDMLNYEKIKDKKNSFFGDNY